MMMMMVVVDDCFHLVHPVNLRWDKVASLSLILNEGKKKKTFDELLICCGCYLV